MAGDVGIHEEVVVHTPVARMAAASAEAVTSLAGGVTHQYGPRVVIAAVPPHAVASVRAAVADGEVAPAAAAISEDVLRGLDDVGAMGLEAFALRQSPEYLEAKAERPRAGEDWDAEDVEPPGAHDDESEGHALDAGASTSVRLTGKVAVGIVIVEGPTNALKFTAAERTKVVAEVQNGLSWLGSQSSPAGISWSYDIKVVTLTTQPNNADTTLAQKEARWRDPAMQKLGFATGMAGVQAYVNQLRTNLGTDWAYCAFFVKYPVGHFAYASIGGPRMVMHYANDGWGPDNIDRVFAHESGHIFGAPDEYAASNCNCGGQYGPFNVPNTNCAVCAPAGGVPCIMRSNEWAMCQYTPYHLGFPQGLRYSGVFLPGTDAHGLWVNADWQRFHAKWQEWSGQGLRLTDIEIAELGGQLRYSGAFRAGTDAHGLWVNADWPSFHAKWQQWSNQGLRLVDLEVTQVGGQPRYTGVFRAGTGAYALWVNADWASFQAKWQQLSGQGLRLVDLEIAQIGGQTRYSGVFRAGAGGYALWVNSDWASFQAKWQQWSTQGLRLTDVEILTVNGQPRYSGVFGSGTGGHALWADVDWASFQAKWKELSGQGLRLVDFAARPTGIEVAAAPVAEGFSAIGGVSLAAAAAEDLSSGAGYGDFELGATLAADGAGFGELVTGTTAAADEPAAGFGEAVLDVRTYAPEEAAAGFGEAVFEAPATVTPYGNGEPELTGT
jgi:hypothetical protein